MPRRLGPFKTMVAATAVGLMGASCSSAETTDQLPMLSMSSVTAAQAFDTGVRKVHTTRGICLIDMHHDLEGTLVTTTRGPIEQRCPAGVRVLPNELPSDYDHTLEQKRQNWERFLGNVGALITQSAIRGILTPNGMPSVTRIGHRNEDGMQLYDKDNHYGPEKCILDNVDDQHFVIGTTLGNVLFSDELDVLVQVTESSNSQDACVVGDLVLVKTNAVQSA